jgi:hypothetical protein
MLDHVLSSLALVLLFLSFLDLPFPTLIVSITPTRMRKCMPWFALAMMARANGSRICIVKGAGSQVQHAAPPGTVSPEILCCSHCPRATALAEGLSVSGAVSKSSPTAEWSLTFEVILDG